MGGYSASHLAYHDPERRRSVPLESVEAIYWYGHEEPALDNATDVMLNQIRLAADDQPALRGKLGRNTHLLMSVD